MIGIQAIDNHDEPTIEVGSVKRAPLLDPYLVLEQTINQFAATLNNDNNRGLTKEIRIVIQDDHNLPDSLAVFKYYE